MLTKPLLVGLHLVFAIIGIDAFLWLLGEYAAKVENIRRKYIAALIGVGGLSLSWIFGGYYYVVYYGSLVKPSIKSGLAPWAHSIVMETKEHVFLFLIPMAITALFLVKLKDPALRKQAMYLSATIAGLALFIGLMGFIISAAARWAVV